MQVYFKPWIGPDYEKSPRKILVIGDSHYCGGCDRCGVRGCTMEEMADCHDFTRDVVSKYLAFRAGAGEKANWMTKTFLQFDKIYYGKHEVSAEESSELWNGIAFYNFVQTAVSGEASNTNYTAEDYARSSPMATEVINELRPDLIIVWGNKAYGALSGEGWTDTGRQRGYYTLPDGSVSHCIRIAHPSRAGQEKWHAILADFMDVITA